MRFLKSNFVFLLLVVAAGIMVSCGKTNQYILSGELPKRYDGCRVFIAPASFFFSSTKSLPVDSTVVSNGRFCFRGEVGEQPEVYILSIEGVKDARLRRTASRPVVIEQGYIRVVYDSLGGSISGTPLNNRYMELIGKSERAMLREQQLLLAKKDSVKQLGENADIWYSTMYRIFYKGVIVRSTEQFVREYPGTAVGDYFFFQCSMDLYNKGFIDSVYPLVHVELRNQYETLIRTRKEKAELLNASRNATNVGFPYREIIGKTRDGKEVRLSEYVGKGKLVLLDFWASWCGPCLGEIPLLKKLHEEYGKKGLIVFGFSLDTDKETWQKALDKYQPAGCQISDLKGWESPASLSYGFHSIPHSLLIDESGKIIERNLHGTYLEKAIKKYFY